MPDRIMRLTKSGLPIAWLSRESAATLYAREQVLWSLGDSVIRLHGGIGRSGQQSYLDIAPIVACSGDFPADVAVPHLTNAVLFRRDHHRCLYCGAVHAPALLTRDHVVPRVQGGLDQWTNVVTACRGCNQHKGGRTPEQAGMPLLAVPFKPNVFEFMYLANRHIRGDQMEYLRRRFSGQRDWAA